MGKTWSAYAKFVCAPAACAPATAASPAIRKARLPGVTTPLAFRPSQTTRLVIPAAVCTVQLRTSSPVSTFESSTFTAMACGASNAKLGLRYASKKNREEGAMSTAGGASAVATRRRQGVVALCPYRSRIVSLPVRAASGTAATSRRSLTVCGCAATSSDRPRRPRKTISAPPQDVTHGRRTGSRVAARCRRRMCSQLLACTRQRSPAGPVARQRRHSVRPWPWRQGGLLPTPRRSTQPVWSSSATAPLFSASGVS